jgi:hypothetical protein
MKTLILSLAFLLVSSAAFAQPQVPPGSLIKWDYQAPESVAIDRFEIQFDAQPFVTAGKTQANDAQTPAGHASYSFVIPALTPGPHTVTVRACTTTACGSAASPLAFGIVVIGTPTGLRLAQEE